MVPGGNDSRDAPVSEPMWDLYREAIERFGPVATLLERDDDIPPLDELLAESRRAAAIAADARSSSRRASRAA